MVTVESRLLRLRLYLLLASAAFPRAFFLISYQNSIFDQVCVTRKEYFSTLNRRFALSIEFLTLSTCQARLNSPPVVSSFLFFLS